MVLITSLLEVLMYKNSALFLVMISTVSVFASDAKKIKPVKSNLSMISVEEQETIQIDLAAAVLVMGPQSNRSVTPVMLASPSRVSVAPPIHKEF